MTKHEDYESRRKREESAAHNPGKAPGYDKLSRPTEDPKPHEAAPPEVRKPSRPR